MKKIIVLMMTLIMVLSIAACGSPKEEKETSSNASSDSSSSEDSDVAYVKDKGTLVIGITDFAPMDYKNENGQWIGFDADMAKAFAKSLGVKAEFVEIDWDNKIMELDGKTIDCVWNGMTLTDEVKSSMSCSNAYCNNAQIVIVPKNKADKYQRFILCCGSRERRRRTGKIFGSNIYRCQSTGGRSDGSCRWHLGCRSD